MKITTQAGEFFNSPDYQMRQGYDVIRRGDLVVFLMENHNSVVTATQWKTACETPVSWHEEESRPSEALDLLWISLMENDIASTPRGEDAIASAVAEMS